mgnify:CR=1 FL=1
MMIRKYNYLAVTLIIILAILLFGILGIPGFTISDDVWGLAILSVVIFFILRI